MKRWTFLLGAVLGLAALAYGDVAEDVGILSKAGPQGRDDVRARAAWKRLVAAGPSALPAVLDGLNSATPIAANWLLTAAEAIVANEFAAGRTPPRAVLESFLANPRHHPRGRRIAFEWLVRIDPALRARLLPTFLDDPSLELRREAVQFRWEQIDAEIPKEQAKERAQAYLKLIPHVRERDQADKLVKLIAEGGGSYDLAKHFGFVTTWRVIGPFDHTGVKAFNVAYPPEKELNFSASYEGKDGAKVAWQPATATGAYANVDLNKPLGKVKGAIAYAVAEVESDREQPVEVRVGSVNAIKIFLNGRLLLAHEEYHHGADMDQYVGRGTLNAGKNVLLLKVCQNEQTESYAVVWGFQCRLCDATGGAVPFKALPPPATATESK